MEGFNQCANGHYYKNNLMECPYCPKQSGGIGSGGMFDKTQVDNNTSDMDSGGMFDKTQISGEGGFSNDFGKTQISGFGDFSGTASFGTSSSTTNRDLSKTFIQDNDENSDGSVTVNQIRQSRKITGWIVSFTLDSMGIDFRIYEGVNTIGRDADNTITVDDMSVSGKHVSVLSKKGKFYIKDEMAANGTYINNNELEVGKTYDLNDGDEVRLGTTIFKFRSSF